MDIANKMPIVLQPNEIDQANALANFLSFKRTDEFKQFLGCKSKIIAHFTGNQRGKTGQVACSYVWRILSMHPVPKKNIVYFECEFRFKAKMDDDYKVEYLKKHKNLDSATWIFDKLPKNGICLECGAKIVMHQRGSRVIRFCSESLPGQSSNVNKEGASAEVKNTQYPELKKWLPKFLIKKDITFRNPAITLKDRFGGGDIIVEFVSYSQSVQSTAGQQRVSVWVDEEPQPEFLEEQRPRLVAEDGDLIISLTPANRITYMYDDVFEKAKIYYRSKTIVNKFDLDPIKRTDSISDIAVFQAATDDNPTLSKDDIEALFNEVDDPDALLIRRYGIFKQVSGRIFKSFDYNIHVISGSKYFPQYEKNPYGIPFAWTHVRGIDYHEHVNWACLSMAISPQDEAFVYAEYNPSPENMITIDIARELAKLGCDYKYSLNLVDPLASKTQTNTGMSVIEDLNRAFYVYKKEGLGTGASWEGWDTKSTRGRDEVRKRLMNAALLGKPFANKVMRNGREVILPTLWILDNCKQTAKSLHTWRLEEWAAGGGNMTKERKEIPQQKWSHFCTTLECLFKHEGCRPPSMVIAKERQYDRFHSERMFTHA